MSNPVRIQQIDDEEDEMSKSNARNNKANHHNNQNNPDTSHNLAKFFQAAVGIGAAALGAYGLWKAAEMYNEEELPNLVENQDQLVKKLQKVKGDTSSYPVVGFNCQWTNEGGRERSKVALIQIASPKGEILLIPMEKFRTIPKELVAFLRDPAIVKTGIEVDRDSKFLFDDYGLGVYSTYDLRFLAELTGHRPEGLQKLAGKILDMHIEGPILDWSIIDEGRIIYAEQTVKASVDIFKALFSYLDKPTTKNSILEHCYEDLNKHFVFNSGQWPLL